MRIIAYTVSNPHRGFNIKYSDKDMAAIPKDTNKKSSNSKTLTNERKIELDEQVFENFIQLTEVQFDKTSTSSSKPNYYDDFFDPHLIQFFEVLTEHNYVLTKLHFPIGSQKCTALVKETPWEIDYLKSRFFDKRKRHGSK